MKTRRIFLLLSAFIGCSPLPATAAITAAANRTALVADRTLDWQNMGTPGVNVGGDEPVVIRACPAILPNGHNEG